MFKTIILTLGKAVNNVMTFAQYIDNPMGKSNAVFAARDAYKIEYTDKFDALFMREAGRIKRTLYYDKAHDAYYAHIKIPSETVEKFYYDVVIRFFTDDNAQRTNSSLKDYQVQFFSNDPAFVYTYMYVFLKHNMLVEDLKPKCPKASLTMKPVERNAYEVPGYVKSIYFAYILMSRTDMFLKSTYQNFGLRYSKTALLNTVDSVDKKMDERRVAEAKQKKLKKQQKFDKQRIADRTLKTQSNTNSVKRVSTVKKVGTVNTISGGNRVSKVSTIKRRMPK